MRRWDKISPEGTRDYVYAQAESKIALTGRLRENYQRRGYSEIITPSVEFYDLFTARTNTIPTEMMYKLTDREGRLMVFRPDCTAPIARVVTTRLQEAGLPLRLHYTQNVLRASGSLRGQLDETTQSGAELIGSAGLRADLEILELAQSSLAQTGLPFTLELGNVAFFKAVAGKLPFTPEDFDILQECLIYKNHSALQGLLLRYQQFPESRVLKELPFLFGEPGEVLRRARSLTGEGQALAALDEMEELLQALQSLKPVSPLTLDLGLVPQLDYYTGLVFQGYVEDLGVRVLSGGRYDRLYEALGSPKPAVGFAIHVDALGERLASSDAKPPADCLLYYTKGQEGPAYGEYRQRLDQGQRVEMSLWPTQEETKAYACRQGISQLVIFSENGRQEQRLQGGVWRESADCPD